MRGLLVAATAWLVCSASMAAAPPAKTDVDVYGRLPNIEHVDMSAGGDKIAYIQVDGDSRRLVVKDLAGKVLFSGEVGDKKVRALNWAGDDHVIVTISATQRYYDEQDKAEVDHSLVVRLAAQKAFEVFQPSDTMISATYGYCGAVQSAGH